VHASIAQQIETNAEISIFHAKSANMEQTHK
jgi:hypothetical protein